MNESFGDAGWDGGGGEEFVPVVFPEVGFVADVDL